MLNARCTSTSDPRWFNPNAGTVSPSDLIMKNSGTVSASTGTICTTSSMISIVVRPRNRKRVNAVAARNDISRLSTTTINATTRLFRKYRPKLCTVSARVKLSSVGASVHGRGFAEITSSAGFSAVRTIQYSGNAITAAMTTVTSSAIRRPGRFTVLPLISAAPAGSRW
jgi:hypothetical protein